MLFIATVSRNVCSVLSRVSFALPLGRRDLASCYSPGRVSADRHLCFTSTSIVTSILYDPVFFTNSNCGALSTLIIFRQGRILTSILPCGEVKFPSLVAFPLSREETAALCLIDVQRWSSINHYSIPLPISSCVVIPLYPHSTISWCHLPATFSCITIVPFTSFRIYPMLPCLLYLASRHLAKLANPWSEKSNYTRLRSWVQSGYMGPHR